MTSNETYFLRDPAQYEAIRTVLLPRLKEARGDTQNLRFWSAASSTGQDLVLCRNVMIHFDNDMMRSIMKEIHSTLFRGGWLLLGGAETAFNLEGRLDRQAVGNVTVYVAR
jgi:chemotaxis methyl-accepting protein methylase